MAGMSATVATAMVVAWTSIACLDAQGTMFWMVFRRIVLLLGPVLGTDGFGPAILDMLLIPPSAEWECPVLDKQVPVHSRSMFARVFGTMTNCAQVV